MLSLHMTAPLSENGAQTFLNKTSGWASGAMASPARSHRRSSDGDDVCPICLCPMDEGFSRPENCQHRFDLDCLTEWSKLRLSCPSCRAGFGAIYTYEIVERKPKLLKVQKMEPPKEAEPFEEANPLDFTFCEICGGGQHEELLLICDQCDKGFHTYCLTPPLDGVPATEQWFCPQCEERRNSLPSTSRTAPSARTIRLVQRTALAERVRRVLQRSRRIVDEAEESSESESADVDDEEEEEEGELIEEDGGESEETSEEEDVPEFFDDDARVLAEIDDDEEPALPSVQRRTKKQREAAAKKKKTAKTKKGKRKTSKRTTKGKKRRSKGKRRVKKHRTRTADTKKGPLDAFVTRRGGSHDPVARLSLLGAGLEPVADDDPYDGQSSSLITENSRRFDRPLLRRKDSKNAPSSTVAKNEAVDEEKPAADSCDLLGSIIPEQVKTLAPGRLFAIGGGRFNTTDDFEKYKERKTNLLSSELKAKLGIPVEKDDAAESKSDVSKSRDKIKKKIPSSKPDERRNVTGSSLPHGSSSGTPHRTGDTTSRESTSKDVRRRDEHRMAEDKYSSSSNRDGGYFRDRDERRDYSEFGDSRSGRNDRIYPERRSEERSWRDGTVNEDRTGNRRWERDEDRRCREQPRGVIRQFGTTVRSELDPPGKVHIPGNSGRNVYEPSRDVDRRSDRTMDKHSIGSNHERSEDDRGSNSGVSKLQDRRDFLKLQDRRDASRLQDRRDAPKPQLRRDSPKVQERRDACKPVDRRITPELQDRRDAPKLPDRRDVPEAQVRRDSLKVQESRDGARLHDRGDAPEPEDRRHASTIREKRDVARLHDRSDAPEPEDRRHAPTIREKRNAPRLHNRGDASKFQDRRDSPKLQDRGDAPIQDKRDVRRGDDRRSHERPREVSVQTSPEKPRRHERNERIDSRSRSPRRPEQLIDEIRKNTRDLAHSSDALGYRHSRDEISRVEKPAMNRASKIEESEQEDKGSAKKPVLKSTAEGPLEKAENLWMPTLTSTSALAVTNVASETPATSSSAKHDEEKNSNERVKIIEGFAKEAIKQYKRDITVEEYKNVMRAVVRDCYKRRILDGVKIKDKVDECVRAVKNGEQLDIGHHSTKRPETFSGSSAVPVKRQKISV